MVDRNHIDDRRRSEVGSEAQNWIDTDKCICFTQIEEVRALDLFSYPQTNNIYNNSESKQHLLYK